MDLVHRALGVPEPLYVEWNLTMAAAVLLVMPAIVLFFLAQRAFIEGVTLTGTKG